MDVQFLLQLLGVLFLVIIMKTLGGSYGQADQIFPCGVCLGNTSNCTNQEHVQGRCCVDDRNTIVGLDLSGCNLTTLPDLESVKHIRWLLLENNSRLDCSSGSFHNSFQALINLTKVVLPSRCNCIGGSDIWKSSFNRDGERWCLGQKNSCKELNITCPANSYCLSNGPGLIECLCKPGWFGYKCLIKGSTGYPARKDQSDSASRHGFPVAIIFGSMTGTTLVVIVVLVLIQRRRKKSTSLGYTWVPGDASDRDVMYTAPESTSMAEPQFD